MDQQDGADAESPVLPTVTSSVLGSFFDALAKEDDLADLAADLRKLVLDDGVFAEPAIRTVLFPDAS
ncbi:hypothetical protein MMB232_01264 [Brevundimonas subvibrioides]|jgi:hypothetical protein|uniref:hypothetical protein n=1 Tax=Brevundimonas subvibrioides TaxID=74313 RepID=UPI0032D5B0DC